ncbi:MAG: hypothetical protein H3C47_11705 [Candidatus Cloacimonetes bacterium]|nr:hypothetical protein [Candidatus Cloacimonadota bacterium]
MGNRVLLLLLVAALVFALVQCYKEYEFDPEHIIILSEYGEVVQSFWERVYRRPRPVYMVLQIVEGWTGFIVEKYWVKEDKIYIQIKPRPGAAATSTEGFTDSDFHTMVLHENHVQVNLTEPSDDFRTVEKFSYDVPYSDVTDFYWVNDFKGCRFYFKIREYKYPTIGMLAPCKNQDYFLRFIFTL